MVERKRERERERKRVKECERVRNCFDVKRWKENDYTYNKREKPGKTDILRVYEKK